MSEQPEDEFEDYLTFAQASRLLPGRPHISTLHRWRLRGVRGALLKSRLVGGRRYTTRAWLEEFFAASDRDSSVPPPARTRRREAAVRAAEEELRCGGA